jgi:carbohydrate kinase (thermoresistant glucokinase family)
MITVVMGVSGVGKSTVGAELARRLHSDFVDADDYHSPENIKKMSEGNPLTDEDRQPWLQTLHRLLLDYQATNKDVVLACSALKQKYRDLIGDQLPVTWIYLKSPEADIAERLAHRHGHFANPKLLHSQMEILEEPTNAITVMAHGNPSDEVNQVLEQLPKT